jgi:two-component system, LytTR family, response regulator
MIAVIPGFINLLTFSHSFVIFGKPTPMIKTLIIDDEPGIRRMLALLLKKCCPDIHVAGEADSVASAYQIITDMKPDLVFLDIRMDDGTGFDLLQKFDKIDFHIIFITAFEEYAVKAFRFSAIDYLLKPFDTDELIASVDKLKHILNAELELRLGSLIQNVRGQGKEDKKIVLRTAEKFHFIRVSDIIHCAGDGNYTTFFLASNEQVLVSKTIKEFDELLTEYGFFRPHKSFLINLAYITGLEKGEGGFIIMKNNTRVPISYRKKEEFLRIVEGM